MPILNIRALPQQQPEKVKEAIRQVSLTIAEIYRCDPSQVWITWNTLAPNAYFEGVCSHAIQPEGSHPPLVELLCFEGKSAETIEELLLATSRSLSQTLELGDNIFVYYQEAKSGQVVAGNGIVRKT